MIGIFWKRLLIIHHGQEGWEHLGRSAPSEYYWRTVEIMLTEDLFGVVEFFDYITSLVYIFWIDLFWNLYNGIWSFASYSQQGKLNILRFTFDSLPRIKENLLIPQMTMHAITNKENATDFGKPKLLYTVA